ncbi:MAG: hypothetical protein AABW92_05650 [Nanoarchaeota archaeon]
MMNTAIMQEKTGDIFLQKQIEIMIEMNNKKFVSELQQLKNRIDLLENEVKQNNARKVTAYSENKSIEKKDINRPIDRNEVSPSDVTIEKFFYFGKK